MEIVFLTIFPDFTNTVFKFGVARRAVDAGIVNGCSLDLRDFTDDSYRSIDDVPYGGGPGMVLTPDPIWRAIESLDKEGDEKPYVVYTSPAGKNFDQKIADELAQKKRVVFLCGRYEGIDQRIVDSIVDLELSIGEFILSGGELAAMAIVDATIRRIPGVLGNDESHDCESFRDGLLEYPHYTRPENFRGMSVPSELLTGDHEAIERFRRLESLRVTRKKRPDLWRKYCERYADSEKDV